jgi:hypothetical protein
MAPDTTHHANRSTSSPASPEAGERRVPLLALVLSGALRVRRDGEELAEPTGDGD